MSATFQFIQYAKNRILSRKKQVLPHKKTSPSTNFIQLYQRKLTTDT